MLILWIRKRPRQIRRLHVNLYLGIQTVRCDSQEEMGERSSGVKVPENKINVIYKKF